MKREAKWQVLWSKVVSDFNKKGFYFWYELKQTRSNTLSFRSFEDQQLPSLRALQHNGISWKFSDLDIRLKPCDGASLPPLASYVVIRYPKGFVMVDVEDFKLASEGQERSLSYERACLIAFRIVH